MIEKIIHEIIADTAKLPKASALAIELLGTRIVTGQVQQEDMALPYATFNLQSNLSKFRSNDSDVRQPGLRFQIWHDVHADGCDIRDALIELFENKSFLKTYDNLISIRHENDFAIQEDDGVWQFVIDFETQFVKVGTCGSN